jgi:copper chaperone
MSTLTLKIDGMTCGHCVAAVKRALDSVPGVTEADVAIGSATVHVDDQMLTADRAAVSITEAVAEEGYPATLAS